MNQPTIGQRLFEMHVKNADRSLKVWKWENEPLLDQKAWNDSATELLRGVLTGEIPMPDVLRTSSTVEGKVTSAIGSVTGCRALTNEDLGYKFTVASDHISDASK